MTAGAGGSPSPRAIAFRVKGCVPTEFFQWVSIGMRGLGTLTMSGYVNMDGHATGYMKSLLLGTTKGTPHPKYLVYPPKIQH